MAGVVPGRCSRATSVIAPYAERIADAVGRALASAARLADRRLDALGLAPPALDLPPQVLADLEKVFGGTIDPATVVIRRGHVPGIPHPRAFALPGLIYLGRDPGLVSVADGSAGRLRATPTLVHELVHVWQGRVLGPRYVVWALVEQIRLGRRAYDWRAALDRRAALPVEAHAQLVAEAYATGLRPAPAADSAGRGPYASTVEAVLAAVRAGDASTLRGRTV